MSTYARVTILVVFLFFAGFNSVNAQQYTIVRLSTAMLIQGDDFNAARLTAITQAKKRCVQKVLKSYLLKPEEYQQNIEKLKKLFLANPEPYIAQFSIENEEIEDDGQRYNVLVSAKVLKDAIKVALVEYGIGETISMGPKPTVMVLISERFDTQITGTRIAETTLINILHENNFKVIDPEQKKLIDLRNKLFSESTGNIEAAQHSAINFKAEYLIFGEALVTSSEPLSGTDLKARYANLNLKIVESSSGQIIASENGQGKAKHIDELTGGNWALEAASNKVGLRVIRKLESRLKQELLSGTEIAVDLCSLENSGQALEAEEILKQTKNVSSVHRRFYFSTLCQFEVRFKGTTSELAEALENKKINDKPLIFIETLPRYLRIKRGEESQVVTDDSWEIFNQYLENKFQWFDMEKVRKQDKELQQRINLLSQRTKIKDDQKKQLYAALKELEAARKESFYRDNELEKRKQELEGARAHAKNIEYRYMSLAKDLEEKIELIDSANLANNVQKEKKSQKDVKELYNHILKALQEKQKTQSGQAESDAEELENLLEQAMKQIQSLTREMESEKKRTYIASQNYSNAKKNKSSSAFKYIDSINEGIELADRISQFISSF